MCTTIDFASDERNMSISSESLGYISVRSDMCDLGIDSLENDEDQDDMPFSKLIRNLDGIVSIPYSHCDDASRAID